MFVYILFQNEKRFQLLGVAIEKHNRLMADSMESKGMNNTNVYIIVW